MDAVAPWELSASGAQALEDDLLLCEALAIIGDLDCDLDDPDPFVDAFAQSGAQSPPSPILPFEKTQDASVVDTVQVASSDESANTKRISQHRGATSAWPQLASSGGVSDGNRPKRRRREELLYLREFVTELEDRLTKLRAPVQQERDAEGRDREESDDLAIAMWENVAAHQRQQRHESETENIRLRQLLQDQIQVGKSLERVLARKRPNIEALESISPNTKRLHRTNSRTWSRAQVFDDLVASCAVLYASTPRILSRFDRHMQVSVPRKVELVHDPEDGLCVQTMEQRVVPFHYEEVASEMWFMFPHASELIQDVHEGCVDIEELQFRIVPRAVQGSGEFLINLVKRRCAEADRVVIVYSARVEPSEISDLNMDGISMRHKAWHVIEPLESNPSKGSKMTVFHASVPELVGETLDQERKVGALTNFLLSALSLELEAHHISLENRLIERSIERGQTANTARH